MAPVPNEKFLVIDEESLLLLSKVEKKYSSVSFHTTLQETDASSILSLDDNESDDKTNSGAQIWNSYRDALQKRPLVVKSITAFVLLGLADCMAQAIEMIRSLPDSSFDILRLLRFGLIGLAGAPWSHYYYAWLDKVLPPTQQPWTWTTAIKVVIDQFVQAPALLALIISGMALMEGRGKSGVHQDLLLEYRTALIKNWELWIPATIINIAFVKPDLRVLYDNIVFFFWTIFLSMLLNQKT